MKEELRLELYKCIELYGFTDPRTVAISQALDKPITEEHKRINKLN